MPHPSIALPPLLQDFLRVVLQSALRAVAASAQAPAPRKSTPKSKFVKTDPVVPKRRGRPPGARNQSKAAAPAASTEDTSPSVKKKLVWTYPA